MNKQSKPFIPLNHTQEANKAKNSNGIRKPRLTTPVRDHLIIRSASLDDLLPKDHQVRTVWDYVCKLDLSLFLIKIKSIEGNVGRPATDPRLLLSLWLYATIEGIGSARTIERYCSEHIAFEWLCGDVKTNYHTISDFRSDHGDALDDLLTQSVGILMKQNLVSLKRVSQDGVKVRANASASSFRREKTLNKFLEEAKEQLNSLKKEIKEDPSKHLSRIEAAKKRTIEEREINVEKAINQLITLKEEITENRAKDSKKEVKKN